MSRVDPQLIDTITRALVDEGKLVEAGWASYKLLVIPEDAQQVQVDESRFAFFAGAQHLFASILGMLEPDAEPTDADLARMGQIHTELERFVGEMKRRIQ